jgi:hypothetical protein
MEVSASTAAGVSPRGQRGARLVLPIFSRDQASFILVQVKDRVEQDDTFRCQPRVADCLQTRAPTPQLSVAQRDSLAVECKRRLSADPPAQCVVVGHAGVFNSARPADTDGSLSETVARWPFLTLELAQQLPTRSGGTVRRRSSLILATRTATRALGRVC